MSKIELAKDESSTYDVMFGIRIEAALKAAIEECKEHAKAQPKDNRVDVNETIRILMREVPKAYWAKYLEKSA